MGAVSQALGLSGEQGESYQPGYNKQPANLYNMLTRGSVDQNVIDRLGKYYTGDLSTQDLIGQVEKAGKSGDNDWQFGMMNQLATNPLTGTKFATEQVQQNPILGQLFGQSGSMQRAGTEEKDLASRGYKLQPEDYEAYGQASGDIARLFGSQEQSLAQALADRGLAAAPSGAAVQGFSGLMGSKFEQLASQQRAIADQRMRSNLERLGQTRNYLAQLGQQGANAIDQQYGRQMGGRQQIASEMGDAARQQTASDASENQMGLAAMQQKIGQKGKTFGEYLGAGIGQAAFNAPGQALSAASGGLSGGGGGMSQPGRPSGMSGPTMPDNSFYSQKGKYGY